MRDQTESMCVRFCASVCRVHVYARGDRVWERAWRTWCDRCEIGRDTARRARRSSSARRDATRRATQVNDLLLPPTRRSTLPPSVTVSDYYHYYYYHCCCCYQHHYHNRSVAAPLLSGSAPTALLHARRGVPSHSRASRRLHFARMPPPRLLPSLCTYLLFLILRRNVGSRSCDDRNGRITEVV